ncbi:hypothetical protein BCV69DRAFT_254515 [Microstroma glucosiphilum]|uniref:rRNA-processing protein EFG1 n=1 Tax=Pseudomicrostroma glucosiphilum TaxID=1684307 RepID=A0A316UHJ5_9BASI|nr:hypothetical protein BCV69DRAFT_254515 [Pseudomicrostroma glucosiphilum]PWN23811.1 hypothetical protein BCV69DRAFT_254515 [Pseudomicrostroma glucosiphilum]
MAKPESADRGEGPSQTPSKRPSKGGEEKSRRASAPRDGKAKTHHNGRPRPPFSGSSSKQPGEVGASKIKAALRQTKRLLAKDKLSSDVRQEAERRLASLESDLARKESSEKERKNAERYHKVRFFERQKLVRQIKKVKKEMAEQPEKKRKKLEAELREKRVLLNYVLHYPTAVKYVALFPSSGESPLVKPAEGAPDSEQSRRARQTHESAMAVRQKVEAGMNDGSLSQEPEMELERRASEETSNSVTKRLRLDMNESKDAESEVREKKRKRGQAGALQSGMVPAGGSGGIEGDDFFATGSDDE